MRPLKASLFFIYCLAALAAVGTCVSHLWTTAKDYRDDSLRLAGVMPSAPIAPAPAAAAAPTSPAQPS